MGDRRMRFGDKKVGTDEPTISVVRALHRREVYRNSALIRQDISGANGFDETEDWEISERFSDCLQAPRWRWIRPVRRCFTETEPPISVGRVVRPRLPRQLLTLDGTPGAFRSSGASDWCAPDNCVRSGSERFAAMLRLSGLQSGSMRQPAKFGPVLGRTSNKELQPKDMLRKRDD